MAKNTAKIVKGVGAGLLTGMVVGFAGSMMLKENKTCRRKAKRALGSVEHFVEDVRNMLP